MSVSAAFLWRFLEDVWDLLPTEDRKLFESYWSGILQTSSDLEQKTIQAALSTEVATVPVFLTERWNRFLLNEDNCDLFQESESLVLNAYLETSLGRETGLYDMFVLTLPSGQIWHEETMRFFDASVRSLRYGKIVNGTLSVKMGGFEFTPNRDYVVNKLDGTIQALDDGRILTTDIVTIRYQHEEYTRGLDYEIDELKAAVRRLASTSIADGETVTARYTYNGTATLPMESSAGAVDGPVLRDETKDFSGLLPGRTLIVKSGLNAGTYAVNMVVSSNELQIAGTFPSVQTSDVSYQIDAFPHGIKVSSGIISIPRLQDRVDLPSSVMIENVDYRVKGGILSVRSAFLLMDIGSSDTRERQMWAETTRVNRETPYRNFGVMIDFYRTNSAEYLSALQGLWYTFWTGSTPGNLQRGLHILLGLPYARKAGTVTRVDTDLGEIDITDPRGQTITYYIPTGLDPEVARYDEVARFAKLTNGVEIVDRNNEPGFVELRLGRSGIDRFLTDNASRGPGSTDETKALILLEHHLFIAQVLTEVIASRVNVDELVTFLDNMKPSNTEYVFAFSSDESEGVLIGEETPTPHLSIDLSTTIGNNPWNQAEYLEAWILRRFTGQIPSGGTQATGNFSDSVDFAALGIDRGDYVRINTGAFKGYHKVLKRFSASLLAIDIPDASIVGTAGIDYVVFTEEMLMDHDAINVRNEHFVFDGTAYSTPASLNTKTDFDFSATELENEDIEALLLVDIGITGAEVQVITDADRDLSEFDVGTPPSAPTTRDHQMASAALKRTNNTGPTVTDAFAI